MSALESDFGAAALHIFGRESKQTLFEDPLSQQITNKSILQNSNVWIHRALEGLEPSLRASDEDTRRGRLGKQQVRFDSTTQMGTLIMSQDRLHAQAQSNFSSVKANVCVFSGRWQYELQLGSKGVMQVGWATADAEFTPETGVGDSTNSYAFDGNRKRKWNLGTSDYGEAWQVGDVIGCCVDLDVGNINFYRNGKDLGEAFSAIPLGPGFAYFPAISLAFEEKVQANFGSLPFKYPIDTYAPVQQAPFGHILRTNQLLHWLYRIASLPEAKLTLKNKEVQSVGSLAMQFSGIVMAHLATFMSRPYIVEACLVPFLLDITFVSQPSARTLSKLNHICDYMVVLLQQEDLKELVNTVSKCLIHKFSLTPISLEYHKQKSSLAMLCDLCQNSNIRDCLLKQPSFIKTRLPEFMDLKPLDVLALKQFVMVAWWPQREGLKTKGKNKDKDDRRRSYLNCCQMIKAKTLEVEALQENLLTMFLNNTDGSATKPSSRKLFLNLYRQFLKDNHITGLVSLFLNNQTVEQTPLPIALSFFHRLVSVLRTLWEKELPKEPVHLPIAVFYSGAVNYFNIDRLGGVLSFLVSSLRAPLVEQLGENHRIFSEPAPENPGLPSVQVQVRGMDTETGIVSTLTRWINIGPQATQAPVAAEVVVAPGPVDITASLTELLDGVILLYTVSAHKQLHKISTLRDDMDKYVTTLSEAKRRLIIAKETCPEAAAEIETSIRVLEEKVEEQSRGMMAWVRGAVFTTEKQANLMWLLRTVVLTLERASQQGDLFAFVPDFYLEAMVHMSSALRNFFNPTLPVKELAGYKELITQVAEILVKLYVDPRVVNLGTKDTIIEALANYVVKKPTLECLEGISQQSQDILVSKLLTPYDDRPWGQSNWVLMRLWQGCGFAFRYKTSPHHNKRLGPRTTTSDSALLIHQAFDPCPSLHYQQLVGKAISENQEKAAELLNSLLKQLNWSFSEFISMMQEIQNLAKRPERVIIDARQLKICATFFDFVVSLLRVLEMICTVCPQAFTDHTRAGTENLLERLCQLLSQILLRSATANSSLIQVISLEVPDLNSVDQLPVLSAVVGVLIALMAQDLADPENKTMSTVAKTLLTEPAFKIESLEYILGHGELADNTQETFSLASYPEAVSEAELQTLRTLISVLSRHKAHMSEVKDVDDEELCLICCAMPLSVTFNPCNHRSCKSCITHHLMDSNQCFFCKSPIDRVIDADDKVIYNAATAKATNSNTTT